jgi:16S rRNA (cytidine1402-2'-O)-methyltransferase
MDSRIEMKPAGILYVVATPIGNREDITLRALRILETVDTVAAEDTRVTRRLLSYHEIDKPMISYHEHNEDDRAPQLIHRLTKGESLALVSNAGTPSVSDPGYRLIKTAIAENIRVVPIPGVSAVISALSGAGIPTDRFVFIGFLPKKPGKRKKELSDLATEKGTMVFYESPKRIIDFMKGLIPFFGDRYAVLSREMTKPHEEFIRGQLSDIVYSLSQRSTVKGECTLLVSGAENEKTVSIDTVAGELQALIIEGEDTLSQIVKTVSKKYNISKKIVYDKALEIDRARGQI